MSRIVEQLKLHFPKLNDPGLIAEIEAHGALVSREQGERLIDAGGYIRSIPLVIRGALKVARQDGNGAEVFLYTLYAGQSCALSVKCCQLNTPSEVRVTVEEDCEFISIPREVADRWMRDYDSWKKFVVLTYSERFNELLHFVDSVMFQKLDDRLLKYLQQKAKAANDWTVAATHNEIALDLNTSREVVSRLLKQMERQQLVKLERNKIQVLKHSLSHN